ncbi:hypothetical protein ABIF90_000573 [Bradyrhizobium japonicum]
MALIIRSTSLDHIVFEGDALRVVLLEPSFRGVDRREDLDVIDVADLLGVLRRL